ncbi:sigma-54-dependent Fis family transcriptional regulator [bacterium]|nr:sigma-54-dependent Fis family transcriptional regulator [candidate division CSSED10-310 bacterium]
MAGKTVLVIDDEAGIRKSLKMILEYAGYHVEEAEDGIAGLSQARKHRPDCVLLDIKMSGMDGLEVLESLMSDYPVLPVIILSGHGSIETAVRATRLGAYDFLEKPPKKDRILLTIRNALNLSNLEARMKASESNTAWEMIGDSSAIKAIRTLVQRVAPSPLPVLVRGESGTGKELVARAIHDASNRNDGPFIQVNCAAIPEDLIENELFGHEKGAYSGAGERRTGKFEMAHHGTLFLDEIGDMSLKTQAKVLRALQEGEYQRVGGNRTLHADVRIVAATNQDLEVMIQEGSFREDLFHRINGVPIWIPPLRDRNEDIPLLVLYFSTRFNAVNGLQTPPFSKDGIEWLQRQSWKGNIRELKNFIERHLILCTEPTISGAYLQRSAGSVSVEVGQSSDTILTAHNTLQDFKDAAEKAFLIQKLQQNNWNIKATAEAIGTPRSNLYKRMQFLGIERSP